MAIASINPATGETLKTYQPLTDAQTEDRLQSAWTAFHSWKRTPMRVRREAMLRAAEILDTEKSALGLMITREMGKTLASAVAEVEKSATGCRYYAEHAEAHLAEESIPTGASRSYIRYEPLGPVLAIMPWNFPFWQVFRFAAPALMAGNTGLLKHASNVPRCALAIEDIFTRAGFPSGVFQTLLIEPGQVKSLLDDTRIVAATLTGSEGAGQSVASLAGHQIKKTVLELGGSDPFIVTGAADLDLTVQSAATARTINNGQSCIAAKRFIVVDSVYRDFETRFTKAMASLKVGDPEDSSTQVGPLATPAILRDLQDQVDRAVVHGAHILTGGHSIERAGNYFQPTVLAGIRRDSPVFHEELFGPVAMLFRVSNLDEAIDLANDSPFGLGSSIWTNDPEEQTRLINSLEAGMVFVNAIVASDARLPFGGVKRSGYGRELSAVGIREFVNIKTVWVK